jgi:LPXTG-site transpeptidase (sortase) family protein
MNRQDLLIGVERGLTAIGVALGLRCAAVLLEARYTDFLPPRSPAATIPGDVSPGRPVGRAAPVQGSWIARLEASTVHLSAPVLEGSDTRTLDRAAGHIEDTAFPGQPGNVGIAGHRDTTFRALRTLGVGDPLIVWTADHVYRYRVTRTFVVKPDEVWVLDPREHPMLTLVTCYPFEFIGHAPKRFIIQADLVE